MFNMSTFFHLNKMVNHFGQNIAVCDLLDICLIYSELNPLKSVLFFANDLEDPLSRYHKSALLARFVLTVVLARKFFLEVLPKRLINVAKSFNQDEANDMRLHKVKSYVLADS